MEGLQKAVNHSSTTQIQEPKCSNLCQAGSCHSGSCLICNDQNVSVETIPLDNGYVNCVCKTGHFYKEGDRCTSCGNNCKACQDSTGLCSECLNDKMELDHESIICKCKTGYYFDETAQECSKCGKDCQSCSNDGKICLECFDSEILSNDPNDWSACACNNNGAYVGGVCQLRDHQTRVLTSCPVGFFLNNGECTKCGVRCDYCSSPTKCTQCENFYLTYLNLEKGECLYCRLSESKKFSATMCQCNHREQAFYPHLDFCH